MALKKQSIRKNMTILVEGREILKEELILISEGWNLTQESFFRKMLKQGGKFSIKGRKFYITVPDLIYNNKGELETALYNNDEE